VAQLHVPGRDPAMRDVMPNVLGAAIGALAGAVPFLDVRRLGDRTGVRTAPWILIGSWLAYRLSPFVPSINLQEWKDSVKPLLREWPPAWLRVVHGAAAWAAVGWLWAAAPPRRLPVRWLPALVAATFGMQVLIVDNVVTPAHVLGAMIGLMVVPFVVRLPGRHAVAALLLAGAILLDGLEPFETGPVTGFEWLPFQGFLQGSMLINAQSLFEKAFFYGALVWFAREAGLRLGLAAGGAALLLAGIEGAQTRLPGHTAEITDPILSLLAGLFLHKADAPHAPPNPVESPQRRKEDL